MKYQFCIQFNEIDVNSSATKAVADCNTIFSQQGYQDFTMTVPHNKNRKVYYYKLFKSVFRFLFNVRAKSIVGIQYPLLSINNVFKYFIAVAKLKNVKFFCIIHDVESLRTGGTDIGKIRLEAKNLNCYDLLIVHNPRMQEWLVNAGVTVPMISLDLFDYLTSAKARRSNDRHQIVYAGNLAKSTFIYALPALNDFTFSIYGPGCNEAKLNSHVKWNGVYSPEEIVEKMEGGFGLIWDGTEVDRCDEILGNYLNYNNPHKASLYLAAGLPLIAPAASAIGEFILQFQLGIVVESLKDLQQVKIDATEYNQFAKNVAEFQSRVAVGHYFTSAIKKTEQLLDFK